MVETLRLLIDRIDTPTGELTIVADSQGNLRALDWSEHDERTRPLLRFIGQAISTRSEVLSVLHLLDKPDAAWDDPEMDRIYEDLRAEFDLVDRYRALEIKLRVVQEALELLAEVARDRRVLWLELIVVVLILLEVAIPLLGYR